MIGIFDSGSGGLTVLRAIRNEFPSVDVVYLGDIKNAPYGSRSREELSKLTADGITYLLGQGAGSIVSACNSVSASLAVSLLDVLEVAPSHLIEMVGPTVSYFRHATHRILVAATPATIASGIYQNAFRMIGKEIATVAIPNLAGAIEFGSSSEDIETIITEALAPYRGTYNALIIACTHYPLVQAVFEKIAGSEVMVFDPAIAVAERVYKQLWPVEAGDGKTAFILTKENRRFREFVSELFPNEPYTIEVLE